MNTFNLMVQFFSFINIIFSLIFIPLIFFILLKILRGIESLDKNTDESEHVPQNVKKDETENISQDVPENKE